MQLPKIVDYRFPCVSNLADISIGFISHIILMGLKLLNKATKRKIIVMGWLMQEKKKTKLGMLFANLISWNNKIIQYGSYLQHLLNFKIFL